jgi:hypothetical protein
MMFNHNEIIEEITAHIRKFGGDPGEWSVGTAKDARGPFFRRHLVADLGDGLMYREAFTTTAADQVIDHLVKNCGLKLAFEAERRSAPTTECGAEKRGMAVPAMTEHGRDAPATSREAERCSALQDLPEPGKLVFVYRPAELKGDPAPPDAALHRLAA